MILYVNGDSHSAGAEAVNSFCFAKDDPLYWALGNKPHPDNERASYGCQLANSLNAILKCDARSASSNARILRTTLDYLFGVDDLVQTTGKLVNQPDLLIIGWATWEREEWFDSDTQRYWQVNAGGIGHDWPPSIKNKYKQWVIDQMDPEVINTKLIGEHSLIYQFHKTLNKFNIPHLFFNTYSDFSHIQHLKHLQVEEYNWDNSYIGPYDPDYTYYNWLKAKGFKTATPTSYHYKADAHAAWAEFLYQHYVQKLLTN